MYWAVRNMREWQRLRSSLNHDWLKNEYLKNLDGLIVQMESSRSFDATMKRHMRAYLSSWKSKYFAMEELLDSAEERLSPHSLFESEPLIRCSPENKAWLAPLIHGLWLCRYGIREKVEEARQLLLEADQSYELLEGAVMRHEPSASITELLETFTDTVKGLSRLLSSFPDKVVTV